MRKNRSFSTLNHAGSAEDNPVLEGVALRLTLHKHDSSETVKKCWIQFANTVFFDLTSLCVSTTTEVTVDTVVGTHFFVGENEEDLPVSELDISPLKNVVHFTTSLHRHSCLTVWAGRRPPVMITLDGYNAEDPARPLVYPFYRA